MLTQIKSGARIWPAEGLTRVPYWVYQDEDLYRRELERIFLGPSWSFLCLDAELPDPGCFLTTSVGEMPVVVTRDAGRVLRAPPQVVGHAAQQKLVSPSSHHISPVLTIGLP